MRRRPVTFLLPLVLLGAWVLFGTASARADVASAMQSELAAAGVPSASVAVATPGAATSTDLAAYDADPVPSYPSLSPENLLSPDPTLPLPVATVTFGKSQVTPLPGIVQPPGVSEYYAVEDAEMPSWLLEVMSALKHRIGAGAALAGVAFQRQFPNRQNSARPDLYLTPPDEADYPATPLPQTMSLADVQAAVEDGRPRWAQAATVSAIDAPGGQRRVTIGIQLPASAFPATNPQQLSEYLLQKQLELNQAGANIGEVVVRVTNSGDDAPLLSYAGDATWGQNFVWVHPLVQAYVSRAIPGATGGSAVDLGDVSADKVSEAQETVTDQLSGVTP